MMFSMILLFAMGLTGCMWLVNRYVFEREAYKSHPLAVPVEFLGSLFSVFVIVFVVRSFIIEPFRIPSSSLEPTLLVGDFVAVNKAAYGLRFPIWNKKLVDLGQPKRGDIVVFGWPPNSEYNYIKRVIGVPGDIVVYHNKVLTINGVEAKQNLIQTTSISGELGQLRTVERKQEQLGDVLHDIYVDPLRLDFDFKVSVPKGYYFVMGDNRDHSSDSRYWGFVPDKNLLGRAFYKWMSWDSNSTSIRWSRIGDKIT